ncbi:MAG: hypothetical protein Q8853_02755, partial [Candidatus Phytoplasma australasiaticum]|nr:hypothetical protein [Candidatus Phytoplasma australasiaticum]
KSFKSLSAYLVIFKTHCFIFRLIMNGPIAQLKGKNEFSSLQLELQEKVKDAELKLNLALERNATLERDLVKTKEELNKSLK